MQQPADADRREDAGGEQAVAHGVLGGLTTSTEQGALMRHSLAHASEGSDSVEAATSDDQEVGTLGCGDERVDRLSVLEADVLGDRIDRRLIEVLPCSHGNRQDLDVESVCKARATSQAAADS